MPYVAIRMMFDQLGVASFGAALPEGDIHWMDDRGNIVARAKCAVVLSWAEGNRSILWGTKLPGFAEAGVPVVPLPEGQEESVLDVDKDDAESIATSACIGTNDPFQFMYEAPTGGGCLFLAVREFRPGAPNEDAAAGQKRLEKARAWAASTLANLANVLEEDATRSEAIAAMGALGKNLRNQADLVIAGLPAAASVRMLAERVEDLQAIAEHDPAGAATALRAEVSEVGRWSASVGDA
jgi:hypothetical protein